MAWQNKCLQGLPKIQKPLSGASISAQNTSHSHWKHDTEAGGGGLLQAEDAQRDSLGYFPIPENVLNV